MNGEHISIESLKIIHELEVLLDCYVFVFVFLISANHKRHNDEYLEYHTMHHKIMNGIPFLLCVITLTIYKVHKI